MLKNSNKTYGWVSITLHWLMAVIAVGMFAIGLYMTDLNYYHPWYKKAPHIHKSIGFIFVCLLLYRTVWAAANPKPQPAGRIKVWESRLAATVHRLLYVLLYGIICSGYLISTADGRSIPVFSWFEVPAVIAQFEKQEDIAGAIHFMLAIVTAIIVVLHAGVALWHHFINRDVTLLRMLGINTQTAVNKH